MKKKKKRGGDSRASLTPKSFPGYSRQDPRDRTLSLVKKYLGSLGSLVRLGDGSALLVFLVTWILVTWILVLGFLLVPWSPGSWFPGSRSPGHADQLGSPGSLVTWNGLQGAPGGSRIPLEGLSLVKFGRDPPG